MKTGEQSKKAGMSRSKGNPLNAEFAASYVPFVLEYVTSLPRGTRFTSDEINGAYRALPLPLPGSPHPGAAFGANFAPVLHDMIERRICKVLDERGRKARHPADHAHIYAVYIRL